MSKINLKSTVIVSDDQVSCDMSGEAAILNFKKGMYYGLDDLGAELWQAMQKPAKVASLKEIILKNYAVDSTVCEKDLLNLLVKLQDQGLIIVR